MTFTQFKIKYFRCFQDEQVLTFAQPTEKVGSGITYIVGANNSGKSTIIEGLSIRSRSLLNSSDRIDNYEPGFSLYGGKDSSLKRRVAPIRSESCQVTEDPQLGQSEAFEIISSRRSWTSEVRNTNSVENACEAAKTMHNRQTNIDVPAALRKIEENDEKYHDFIKLVKKVIPEFTKFTVGCHKGVPYLEYIDRSGKRHATDFLGDGVITAIRILVHLSLPNTNPLVIDEPELSLHTEAQKALLEVIAEHSTKRQIIISTHSPQFIHWKYLENGAVLNRVVKLDDQKSLIYSIDNFENLRKLINSANWQQPFLLDAVAKEIFFMRNNILFLEGQEDVGLLRKIKHLRPEINIFGYGVRGMDNFTFYLQLCKNLRFEKVACFLDKGDKENKIKTDLENKFPDYGIIQSDKADIRDKWIQEKKIKDGYFYKTGKLKPEEEKTLQAKMAEIEKYFFPAKQAPLTSPKNTAAQASAQTLIT